MKTTKKKQDKKSDDWEVIRCQFCERESRRGNWRGGGDVCPDCGKKYDPILAQEGDD